MGVLLMLMTIGGLVVAAVLYGVGWIHQSAWLKKFVVGGVAVWLVFYVAVLLGFSLASREKTLPIGEAKEFCGFYLDCHLHAAVAGVTRAKTIGNKTAKGEFYIVRVRVFSDARNPQIAFHLIEPDARVVLSDGSELRRDTDAEALTPTAGVRLDADIKGSQTIEKEIVFDIDHADPDHKLLITEGYGIDKWIEFFLVGDEDSILHKQTYLAIGPSAAQ